MIYNAGGHPVPAHPVFEYDGGYYTNAKFLHNNVGH